MKIVALLITLLIGVMLIFGTMDWYGTKKDGETGESRFEEMQNAVDDARTIQESSQNSANRQNQILKDR